MEPPATFEPIEGDEVVFSIDRPAAPTLRDVEAASHLLSKLLRVSTLTDPELEDSSVTWRVEKVTAGSLIFTLDGAVAPKRGRKKAWRRRTPRTGHLAHRVAQLVRAVSSNESGPGADEVRAAFTELSQKFPDASTFTLMTPDGVFPITRERVLQPTRTSLGAIEGRIEAASTHSGLRFTLYDLLDERAISCFLTPDRRSEIFGLWGERVAVSGTISRDVATGRPLSIRSISGISPLRVPPPWPSGRIRLLALPERATDLLWAEEDEDQLVQSDTGRSDEHDGPP
jgi:hypothetical protein